MTAREIPLPPLAPRLALGALIERAEIDGHPAFTVTSADALGRARRRWFADRALAVLHAADQADALGLPLLDLSGEPDGAEG